jgi:hypothetical protein
MKTMLTIPDPETREITFSDLTREERRELRGVTADRNREPVEEPEFRIGTDGTTQTVEVFSEKGIRAGIATEVEAETLARREPTAGRPVTIGA